MDDNLPNADRAEVELRKLTDYLLSTEHPRGKSKAKFFMGFGFSSTRLELFSQALKKHGATQPVVEKKMSEFGEKFVLECTCETPDNRNPCIRSVWILEGEDKVPRFVTAHPR